MLVVDMDATGKRIKEKIKGSRMKVGYIRKQLGVSSSNTFYRWFHGYGLPDTERLFQLADLLGCAPDDLIVTRRV